MEYGRVQTGDETTGFSGLECTFSVILIDDNCYILMVLFDE